MNFNKNQFRSTGNGIENVFYIKILLNILFLTSHFSCATSSSSPLSSEETSSFMFVSSNKKPRISIISPKNVGYNHLYDDSIDISSNDNLHLRCIGPRPMFWIIPNNNYAYESISDYSSINITQTCDENSESLCRTDIQITDIQYDMTGLFICQYNQTQSNALQFNHPNQTLSTENILNFYSTKNSNWNDVNTQDSVYIFVNDAENLIVPYEGATEFQFVAVFQSQPATIPCKPTISTAKVSLWKTHTKNNVEAEIRPNSTLGISFNPKKGFYFESPRWDSDTHILQCRFQYGNLLRNATITVHWSILPKELHPQIDDSEARNVFVNTTFTLKCFVNIEIGVIIVIEWDLSSLNHKNDTTKRIVKSDVETQRTSMESNSYDTVSVNLTVHNALESDSGEYRCNVTDGKGRISSTVKRINVFDANTPTFINLSTALNVSEHLYFDVNDRIELNFVAHAIPDISIFDLNWFHNSLPLNNDFGRIEENIFTDKNTQVSLVISSAKASDSGRYTLVANSSSTFANISTEIVISGEPEIVLDYTKMNYLVNNSFLILCKAFAHPIGKVWWSWIDCKSLPNCLEGTKIDEDKIFRNDDSRWTNLTECKHDDLEENNVYEQEFCSRNIQTSTSYLNTSVLNINRAQKTGVFRCSSINRFNIIKHHQTSFIITDDRMGYLNIIQIPEEPTTNDTIILTCRASIFVYKSILWMIGDKIVETQTFTNSSYSLNSTIIIPNARPKESGHYRCEADSRITDKNGHKEVYVSITNLSIPAFVDTNMKNDVIKKEIHSQFELRCFISGRPKPNLFWFRDGEILNTNGDSGLRFEDNGQRIVFTRLLEKNSGKYECRAENRAGAIAKNAYLVVNDDDITSLSVSELIIYSLFFILAIAILVISVFIGRKLHQDRLRKRELELFSQAMFENGQMEMFNPDMPLDEQIDLLPYDSRYEFPKENLKLGRTLGQGAFGRVVKAEAYGIENENEYKTVAVKMLKERANTDHRKALMAELKILIHLGRHVNIVNLLGAVTRNIAKGELLVIVEYCELGNLRDFLLANRDNFHNEIHPKCHQNGEYQNVPSSKNQLEYQNSWKNGNEMAFFNHNYVSGTASVALSNSSMKKTQKPLFSTDLISYSYQCSRGMEYLTRRKLIHRDLAARNVLLDSNYIVKICDFGLAKDVYKDDNYVKMNSGPLPIKWMAIESMTDKIFTSKSDVWSFGILLWEIFTLGKNPYPGIEINEEFYQKLKAGYRMEKPEYCNEILYELMLKCWDPSPVSRPDFEVISHIIGEMLPSEKRQYLIDLNVTFEEMNQELLRNDYMKMASVSDEDYLTKDGLKFDDTCDDYLQMHDDRKVFVNDNCEVILMNNINNNNNVTDV